jgi:hypothetical protein
MEIELLAPSLDLFLLVLAEHFPQVAFFFLLIPFHLSKIEPQSPSQLFISTAMCVRVPMQYSFSRGSLQLGIFSPGWS